MEGSSLEGHRVERAEDAFESLPERYRGAPPSFHASYLIELEDCEQTWHVTLDGDQCVVSRSPIREPDTIIGTDTATWLALRAGTLSGLDAFRTRRLWARGNLDRAVAFESFFELPARRKPLLRLHDVDAGKASISTLTAGNGAEQVILIHGLGGTKSSFYETVSALAPERTVHAIDLPGFGGSSKPARAPYDAPWFARSVLRFMDAMEIERAHVVGNSMGGRVAIELGLREPGRLLGLSLLAPSLAWRRHRELVPIAKLLRPEMAVIPHTLSSSIVRRQFFTLFARPERLHPTAAALAGQEFLATYSSRGARVAFYSALRNIYVEEPFGKDGFWTRLAGLEVPSLFVWGSDDPLVPMGFSRHVTEVLPEAQQAVLQDCGHVPQVELPEHTHRLVKRFIGECSGSARERAAARLGRAARRLAQG